ncbi:MAG: ABC transporter, ATP-binding protein (cluster 11, riboflavin/purine nucleoside/unknown) / ABC transporter, ATP-binding protein (cluster 11, riboflavin/purine nucleoside/unknown) [uncultured Thermomicrobiales bacterium]|uniref:ABC transporter domain-containing protein n=1 Tax=uncultured Thermomicrobiales bacterium TaxID=1645740 RepID=A0A6J4UQ40_9BACT|nr:MAG: ABC transporter, ATP-binding protein (cluster 11, riboflavin/purine nucleoside/unknown) / ABC transporter, ATP-binding protein (cluster 11, riboflavin/purine nucleoside/unknown) [uncultured Thermomicrobiales bacterium]
MADHEALDSADTRHFALEAREVTKRFSGVLANDRVSFAVAPGEVHALLGENGAGKSTLMNILYGLYTPDEGEILVGGEPARFGNPSDAIARGIGMVHQHFMLIPPLTVTENIMLGNESRRGRLLDRATAAARITELSRRYGLDVDPQATVADLSVGAQQRVEILKAFYRDARVLILDEPTAVLTPQEADDLFAIMRGLRAEGKSLIFITHKLREVLAIADRITVLRGGRVVGQARAADVTEHDLARLMVGRSVALYERDGTAGGAGPSEAGPVEEGAVAVALGLSEVAPEHAVAPPAATAAAPLLRVEGLTVRAIGGTDRPALDAVSFTIAPGEIFGIAGVEGNGQTELAAALTGLRRADGDYAWLGDREITGRAPRELIAAGVAHIPEDRQKDGLVLPYSIGDNLVLSTYRQSPFARGILLRIGPIRDFARRLIDAFDIRAGRGGADLPAGNLSGGNQQKVIIARELSRPIRFLVAAQPTRGLDVGSIEFIHAQLVAQRAEGRAILLISAELDELLALADRIGVLYRGRLVATLPRAEATWERLGLLMAGGE